MLRGREHFIYLLLSLERKRENCLYGPKAHGLRRALLNVEVDGRQYKLTWREAAVLLVMRLVDWNALTLSDVELVATGHAGALRTVNRLVEMELVESYNVRGTRIYLLTERGAKAADEIRRKAEAAGLWRIMQEALGG
ncbi:MAG: hypothetical protein QXW23_07630 [Thermofilaceae archaeon]